MTQCGDPLHNALAERMNNTIKNGWLFDCDDESFEQVSKRIEDAVYVYNHAASSRDKHEDTYGSGQRNGRINSIIPARRDGWSRPLPLGRSPTEEFLVVGNITFS